MEPYYRSLDYRVPFKEPFKGTPIYYRARPHAGAWATCCESTCRISQVKGISLCGNHGLVVHKDSPRKNAWRHASMHPFHSHKLFLSPQLSAKPLTSCISLTAGWTPESVSLACSRACHARNRHQQFKISSTSGRQTDDVL